MSMPAGYSTNFSKNLLIGNCSAVWRLMLKDAAKYVTWAVALVTLPAICAMRVQPYSVSTFPHKWWNKLGGSILISPSRKGTCWLSTFRMERWLGSPLSTPSSIFPKNLCLQYFERWKEFYKPVACCCLHFTSATDSSRRSVMGPAYRHGFFPLSTIGDPELHRSCRFCH